MYYTYEHYEDDQLIVQLDVEVYGDLMMTSAGPEIVIEKLYMDSVNILHSPSDLTKHIAEECKGTIEEDWEWQCEQAEEAGWSFSGQGNDPDAHWKAPKIGDRDDYDEDKAKETQRANTLSAK